MAGGGSGAPRPRFARSPRFCPPDAALPWRSDVLRLASAARLPGHDVGAPGRDAVSRLVRFQHPVGCTYSIFLQIDWIGYAAESMHSTPYREPIEQVVVNVFRTWLDSDGGWGLRWSGKQASGGDGVSGRPPAAGRVVSGLFFFPRGGSAQVARELARALPRAGWQARLAAGSLGRPGELTNACSFFAGIDVEPLDYSPALELADPLTAPVPFPPSYEDRPGAPDRVFAAVDDAAFERLVERVDRGARTCRRRRGRSASSPSPDAGQRGGGARVRFAAGGSASCTAPSWRCCGRSRRVAPPGWRFASRWAARMRRWAQECARLIVVPPGAEAEAALLLGLERARLRSLPSGVELDLFRPARSTARSGSRSGAAGWSSSRSVGTRAAAPAASPTATRSSLALPRGRSRSCSMSAATRPSSGCRC